MPTKSLKGTYFCPDLDFVLKLISRIKILDTPKYNKMKNI